MKRSILGLIVCLWGMCLFAGNDEQVIKQYPFNYGEIKDSVYHNPYFKFNINIPSNWIVQNKSQIEYVMDAGKKLMTTDDETLNSAMENADAKNMTLLMLSKYELGAPVDYNPSVIVMAEDISMFYGIKRGNDYLFHVKAGLAASTLGYEITGKAETDTAAVSFGSKSFDYFDAKANILSRDIFQSYYSTIINRYAFSVIISFGDEEQKKEMEQFLQTIKFTDK